MKMRTQAHHAAHSSSRSRAFVTDATLCLPLSLARYCFRYDVIPHHMLGAFDAFQIEWLVCGSSRRIDVADWKANTRYLGFDARSQVVVAFWSVVDDFTEDERHKLLQFVTGASLLAHLLGTTSHSAARAASALHSLKRTHTHDAHDAHSLGCLAQGRRTCQQGDLQSLWGGTVNHFLSPSLSSWAAYRRR